jgi:Rrf2 family protein
MIKISKRAQYGMRAMAYLAKNYKAKKVCSVNLISEDESIPFEFLEKIIIQLEKAKLVKATKGIKGGYVLAKTPNKISANDIVSILEDNQKPVDCAFCGRKAKCMTKNVWLKIGIALNKTLKSITLKDLIE